MLDILKRGTVEVGGAAWEYHGDTVDPTVFYVTPQPVWMMSNGVPEIEIVEYQTSDAATNGSGYCTLKIQLGVPDSVMPQIVSDIVSRFGVATPKFLTLPFQTGTVVNLTYPDGQGGTTGLQAAGTDFGANAAIFQVPLDADQMKTVKAALREAGGSPFEVQYSIIAPAHMAAVTAELSFDSTTAFNYEVTAYEHTHWAESSSWTYDIQKKLAESNASSIIITKVDPSLPESVVDRVREWGQATIADMVKQQVQAALALEQGAGGTQSFSISQVASFKETYQQNEVVLWRLLPQAVLPSFGDLGLTERQIESLESVVDKRQFVATVTPQCLFKGSSKGSLQSSISPGDNPFMTNVIPLDHIDVTVTYPTLTSSESRTHTFTDNTPFTWQGDWDDAAGGVYSLSYKAVYADADNTTVTGKIDNIDATAFTLTLASIGTLNVTFDASRFFAIESKLVDELTVDFVFLIPGGAPFLVNATLSAASPQHTFSSISPVPITTGYIYTVTYIFNPTVTANPYTTDAKQQNGQWVRLAQPDLQQSFNVIVDVGDPNDPEVLSATINFYYDGTPYFPDIPASENLPAPTDSSPIQLNFPISGSQAKHQMQTVTFFANTKATPLTVNASLIDSDGNQVQLGPYDFSPQTVALLLVSASKQFAFLEAEPTIVDWTTKPLASIIVHVTGVRYNTTTTVVTQTVSTNVITPPQTIRWDSTRNQAYPVQFLVSGLPNGFSDLEFDWYAEYVYKDGILYTSGTERGATLALPASASDPKPPASGGAAPRGS
ncbi:hypothetical protein [Sorangium sp. So ce1000]|uniref:hypothetical protein n=1 Tax=Sorangium sp. So ce1000 TaxID=3133325 RepID=UPI003F63F1CC